MGSDSGGASSKDAADAPKSRTKPNWALRAAVLLGVFGCVAFLYVLFAASSKPSEHLALTRFAHGELERLVVLDDPPPLPGAPLRRADGEAAALMDNLGRVTLVNLWATWCWGCMEELPTLADLARRYEGSPFRVVAVNIDAEADHAKAQRQLAEKTDGALEFITDPSRRVIFDLSVSNMPTTILYDEDGREIARISGAIDWDSPEVHALIDAVLNPNAQAAANADQPNGSFSAAAG